MEVDYVRVVVAPDRAVDDVAPLLLDDPRAAETVGTADFLWVRVLDAPAALSARTYAVPGRVVLEVTDTLGHAAGRFAVEGGPDGATCAPTTESADLTLPVGALGQLLLGDGGAARLAEARLLDEERPGAAARLDAMFTTARSPWCPDWF
jgi:predicted acetyltransferase